MLPLVRAPVGLLKQIIIAVIILGVAGVLWQQQDAIRAGLGLASEMKTETKRRGGSEVPVIVAGVTSAKDDLLFEAVGTGRAKRSVMLRLEAEGKVVASNLVSGQRFAAGDVLLSLEDEEQRLALAETRRAEARRVLERFQRLRTSGAAATATLDQARTEAEIAALEVEKAQKELEDRVLRAPFGGVVGLPDVEVGDWVDSGVDIATLDDRSLLLVEFNLPEQLLSRIEPGLLISATTPAFGGKTFRGAVIDIDTRVDATSRAARIRVAIPNDQDELRPGASFTVSLTLPGSEYPVVPELAVQFSKGILHVWRVNGETAEKVEVRLVRRRNAEVLVEGPLSPGDQVVVEGTQRLAPSKKITIVGGSQGAGS
jgi:RND family efflux transporter MFP subunit